MRDEVVKLLSAGDGVRYTVHVTAGTVYWEGRPCQHLRVHRESAYTVTNVHCYFDNIGVVINFSWYARRYAGSDEEVVVNIKPDDDRHTATGIATEILEYIN